MSQVCLIILSIVRSDFYILNIISSPRHISCTASKTVLLLNTYSQYIYFLLSDPQPSCSKKTKNGVVNASCSFGFSGNWPPVIEWDNEFGVEKTNYTTTVSSQRVTSILIVPLSHDPEDSDLITCTVKFKIEDKPPETTATNIPELLLDTCKITIEASG